MTYEFIYKDDDSIIKMSCTYEQKDELLDFFANFLRAAGFQINELYDEDVQTDQ